jgi:glutathione reductase (NADPH)
MRFNNGGKDMKHYDLVVIGSGSGGASVAYACKEKGWHVAIVDKQPLGGTCALRGCNPKKVLVGAADIVDHTTRMKGLGIEQEANINWKDLMAFKRSFTKNVPSNSYNHFIESGIDVYQGVGHFISDNKLEVNDEILQADKFLIAAGSKPRPLQFNGHQHVLTSDDFLELEELPNRIVFVGGGYISFEFSHIATKAGAQVSIIHRSNKPLKEFDEELVNISKKQGIDFFFEATIQSIEKQNDELIVHFLDRNQKPMTLVCDAVFHGAGRVADIQQLDLKKANVSYSDQGIEVNQYLQSVSNMNVYAAGDSANTKGFDLTTVAATEARIVTYNLLNEDKIEPDYRVVASVVFTQPKLALLGLGEKQTLQQNIKTVIKNVDMSDWYTSKRTNESSVLLKLILDFKTNEILGVHILGENADDLINHFAMIMTFNLPFDQIRTINFAYPTSAYDLKHLL